MPETPDTAVDLDWFQGFCREVIHHHKPTEAMLSDVTAHITTARSCAVIIGGLLSAAAVSVRATMPFDVPEGGFFGLYAVRPDGTHPSQAELDAHPDYVATQILSAYLNEDRQMAAGLTANAVKTGSPELIGALIGAAMRLLHESFCHVQTHPWRH